MVRERGELEQSKLKVTEGLPESSTILRMIYPSPYQVSYCPRHLFHLLSIPSAERIPSHGSK